MTTHRHGRPAGAIVLACVGAALLSLALPGRAQAQLYSGRSDFQGSPQSWATEIRLGPYSPDVDTEFGGAKTPHQDLFGKGRRLMTQIEVDYQFLRAFGSLGLGLQIGYFRERAKAFVEPEPGQPPTRRSGDRTQLSLIPMSLLLVYRLDYPALEWNLPIIPYAKVGLNYTIWSVYEGNDKVATSDIPAGRGRGGSRGWMAAAGLSFMLDIVDPGAARALDGESGINHTHVFVEMAKVESGLGKSGQLQVGDTTWSAGLLFEF